MVAIRRNILRKTITYMLIGALTVTSLTSFYTQSVFAEEEITRESGSHPTGGNSDNPYKGNSDNVFDLMKNSWIYTITQLGFFVNDMCTFDLSSIGVGACQNKMDYEAWLTGHNMTADDVVESYDASTGTVNLSINYVKNVYNDVLDAVQKDEGWFWSSGKSGYSYLAKYSSVVYKEFVELAKNSNYYVIFPYYGSTTRYDISFVQSDYSYINVSNKYIHSVNNMLQSFDGDFLWVYSCDENGAVKKTVGSVFPTETTIDDVTRLTPQIYHCVSYFTSSSRYGSNDLRACVFGKLTTDQVKETDYFTWYLIKNHFFGPKQKIYINRQAMYSGHTDIGVLIKSLTEDLSSISIKLDDLNRDWLKVNNEIKDLIDDYMKDFQDYTEKQDKIDAAISSTLATMNENLAAGKEDLIGAIKESAAVQQLWLERIYNKEVEIYTKYLEENEQTQAVLVGIANQLKEYFEASLKNQGNYLTYDQFAAYAQQIIDAINNSGGTSGTGTDGSAVDMSTVDEYIKKIYEKEVNLYDELQAISKKLDNINDNLTKYLWNTDKSIPFLADIANLIKEGFEKCTAPLDGLSEKLDELINLAKSILAVLSLNTLIDSLDRTKSDDEEENASIFTLVKMIMYLVLILGSLVVLFLKILQYIVLMFQIPAEPALFNENILLGWNYANSICIPGTSFSIIAFLRLLMYITVIFTVVKVLRREINNGSIGVIK